MEIKKAVQHPNYTVDNVEKIDLKEVKKFLSQVGVILSKSYGPSYKNAMVLNGPSIQVIHDGYTILKSIATLHPFCKHLLDILTNISGRLNVTVGDGTTTGPLLAIVMANKCIDYVLSSNTDGNKLVSQVCNLIDFMIDKYETTMTKDISIEDAIDALFKMYEQPEDYENNNFIEDDVVNDTEDSNNESKMDSTTINLILTAMGLSSIPPKNTFEYEFFSFIVNVSVFIHPWILTEIRANNMSKLKNYSVEGFEFTGAHGDFMFEGELFVEENIWELKNTNILLIPSELGVEFTKFIMMLSSNESFLDCCKRYHESGNKTLFTFMSPKFNKSLYNAYHESLYKYFKNTLGFQPFMFLEYNKSIMENSGILDDFIELYEIPIVGIQELNQICNSESFYEALCEFSLSKMDIKGFSSTKNGINELYYLSPSGRYGRPKVDKEVFTRMMHRLRSEILKDRNLAKQIGSYSEILDTLKYEKRLANLSYRNVASIGCESNISTNYYMKIAEDCIKVIQSSLRYGISLGQLCSFKKYIHMYDSQKIDQEIKTIFIDAIYTTNSLAVPILKTLDHFPDYPIGYDGIRNDNIITSCEHDIEILRGLKDFLRVLLTTEYIVSDYILPNQETISTDL